jgi:hypothetical protein
MVVYILTSTAESTNETNVLGVFGNKDKAREEMKTLFESSKKFWENEGTEGYDEVCIELYNDYAEAYCVDSNYERTGMSWNILTMEVE